VEHSLETLENCPSCGGSHFIDTLSCIDHTYSKKEFSIVECKSCNLHFTNPRPDENGIGVFYDNPEYVSHTDTSKGLLFTLYGIVKGFTLGQKRKLLERIATTKSVLDYGAGSGDFSNELASNGWHVASFEPDVNARGLIRGKNSSIELIDSLDELNTASKSIIALWHVLEHVHRLQETIQQFKRILTADGKLIIAVPNHTSYDARFYGENWAAYDVPRHLYHFNPETIETLMTSLGFKQIGMKPMWFDSYYVSLLSEKNSSSNGFINSLIGWGRALLIGSISNLRAIGDSRNCSSITYIFEKAG
jgi:2-polyprenyl-3-methyl-5-hydroxy-6-metoxy-1,4-benzoquinol methylase